MQPNDLFDYCFEDFKKKKMNQINWNLQNKEKKKSSSSNIT